MSDLLNPADYDEQFGRRMAAAWGIPADAPMAWAAYGAACRAALGRGRGKPVPPPTKFLSAAAEHAGTVRAARAEPPASTEARERAESAAGTDASARAATQARTVLTARAVDDAGTEVHERARPPARTGVRARAAKRARTGPTARAVSGARTVHGERRTTKGTRGSAAARAGRAGAPRWSLGAFVRRGLYGVTWRISFVVAAVLVGAAALRPPLLPAAGVIGAGILLGLWHRRWGIAKLWRWAVLAAAVGYVGPALGSAYGPVLAGSLSLAGVAPWGAAFRRARR